ncbi:ABC transporter I member 1 [Ranunculus cassubicifolius]
MIRLALKICYAVLLNIYFETRTKRYNVGSLDCKYLQQPECFYLFFFSVNNVEFICDIRVKKDVVTESATPKAPPERRICMRNAQTILRNINVSVHDGTALVLTGANGAGKSTFLRMLAGFSRPSAGKILWNGHAITQSDKLTVLDNVQWFELLEGKHGKAKGAIELMGLGRLMNEKARMLSLGQRKRLQLARVLAIDRPIWLLDEPSVALDSEGVKLLEYIISEHRKKGGIVFVATHLPIEIEDAMVLRLPQRFPRRKTMVDLLD